MRRVSIPGSSCSPWGRESNLLSLRALRGRHKSLKLTEKLLILIYTIYRTFTESLVSKVSAWLTKKTEGHPACVNWLTAHAGTFNSARQALRGGEKHLRGLQSAENPFRNPLSPKSSSKCRLSIWLRERLAAEQSGFINLQRHQKARVSEIEA